MGEDIALFNAMIDAFGRNGDLDGAKRIYEAIRSTPSLAANVSTFVLVLSACAHCGDVAFAQRVFEEEMSDAQMKNDEFVVTNVIDCFARHGLLREARELILKYEAVDGQTASEIMFTALLSGCRKFADKAMARTVFDDMRLRGFE